MTRLTFVTVSGALLGIGVSLVADAGRVPRQQAAAVSSVRAASQQPSPPEPASHRTLVKRYCLGCHNDQSKDKAAGLTLTSFDPAQPGQNAEVAEKMVRKLRAGMMPPAGMPRPDAAILDQFVTSLETKLDAAAALKPNPGRRTFQRLNRAEYERVIRDLLNLEIDADAFLPPDTISAGFDNIADVQTLTPTLMEGYLRAASRVATLALGDPTASPTEALYAVPKTRSQTHHIEGTPWGTRGGTAFVHNFPADGEYTIRVTFYGNTINQLFGNSVVRDEQLDISVNGERAAVLTLDHRMTDTNSGLSLTTERIHMKAGPQHLAAAFIEQFHGVGDDLMPPVDYTLADGSFGRNYGLTQLPHLKSVSITGPFLVTGSSDTPSRRKIFVCRPTAPGDETPCARQIIVNLASAAYRQPLGSGDPDVQAMMAFYAEARKEKGFEAGIEAALRALLASPKFVFRFEPEPGGARPGSVYRLSDASIASRLSFFLWQSIPDPELRNAASTGSLRRPESLEKQVRRMLADPRSQSISTRFASQWLRLQDLDKIRPEGLRYPGYDDGLSDSYRRETELLFDSIVREDRNILDLITADYTFVNGRVARVYNIPNIEGETFQRVTVTDPARRGVLGHGSIHLQTSTADRTSAVNRGKWIMEVLLGSPPPPPPPNVPTLEETKAVTNGRLLSTRERMEEHRSNPACASCHRVIDPLGLALENFDVIGAWRIKDNGVAVDANGVLYDGTKMGGPADLRQALLRYSDSIVRNFTKNLMAYALGRRIEYYDEPTVRAITKRAALNGNRFSSFVLGIVDSPAFQMSTADAVTNTR